MKKLFLILIVSVMSCSAQTVYKKLTWDFSYTNTHGKAIDTSNVFFAFYHKDDSVYNFIGTAPGGDSLYYLLDNHPEMYNNKRHYFFNRVFTFVPDTFSVPSDTISAILYKPTPESIDGTLRFKK